MAEVREVCSGLSFPEGPVAMSDGSVVLVEIGRGDGPVDVLGIRS